MNGQEKPRDEEVIQCVAWGSPPVDEGKDPSGSDLEGVDDPCIGAHRACEGPKGGPKEVFLDQVHGHGREDHGREKEPLIEGEHPLKKKPALSGKIVQQIEARSRRSKSALHHHRTPGRQAREQTERNRRSVLSRRYLKRLCTDDDSDPQKDADPRLQRNRSYEKQMIPMNTPLMREYPDRAPIAFHPGWPM